MLEGMLQIIYAGKMVEAHGSKWVIVRHLKGDPENGVFEAVKEDDVFPALVYLIKTENGKSSTTDGDNG